jgi:hypothetical protein
MHLAVIFEIVLKPCDAVLNIILLVLTICDQREMNKELIY